MLPFFAPKTVEKYREYTQELCRKLIREFIEDGQPDVAGEYARQIPQRIIARILGIDPEDGRRLVEEPEFIPSAVEGFLRAYSPVTMESVATQDPVLGDQLVKEGERIVLSFPASSRDPPTFENPEEVIIDRQVNRHIAFGSGILRYAGSNLARLEMQIAICEFLAMVPELEREDPGAVTWAGGQVQGTRYLSVIFPTSQNS
ncbi:MAG: cytochrome P450 [Acidimicrobiales bacterium]